MPNVDDPCSAHFRYADLIACGETYVRVTDAPASTQAPCFNIPLQPATWTAIAQLATTILDPITDRFGPVTLTYGFASPALTRHINSRIAPSLDQHAGSELNRNGNLVCKRRGQACDLMVDGVDAVTVARFIAEQLPFDRLYLYGKDRPLHVSIGPEQAGAVVEMRKGPSGRLIPRAYSASDWLVRQ
ncbi:MAG: hypothetical protein KC502_24000 [Myxococcales bacterium]|nr:hypothetical protein [Myxococcales bacterium]